MPALIIVGSWLRPSLLFYMGQCKDELTELVLATAWTPRCSIVSGVKKLSRAVLVTRCWWWCTLLLNVVVASISVTSVQPIRRAAEDTKGEEEVEQEEPVGASGAGDGVANSCWTTLEFTTIQQP
jgi:hypothetical protein